MIAANDFISVYSSEERWTFENFADGLDFFGNPLPVVVVDDLGSEPRSIKRYGSELAVVATVLERRYRMFAKAGCRTVITTNLTDAEIIDRYGDRINDRLNEMLVFVTVNGNSWRK